MQRNSVNNIHQGSLYRVWNPVSALQGQWLSDHVSLCSSDFLSHRETGPQCYTAPHTAEGHRFYVPCMQLINFCYFVVCVCVRERESWACARFCAAHKLLLLSAFCIRLISLSALNSWATIEWDLPLCFKRRAVRPLFIFPSKFIIKLLTMELYTLKLLIFPVRFPFIFLMTTYIVWQFQKHILLVATLYWSAMKPKNIKLNYPNPSCHVLWNEYKYSHVLCITF